MLQTFNFTQMNPVIFLQKFNNDFLFIREHDFNERNKQNDVTLTYTLTYDEYDVVGRFR